MKVHVDADLCKGCNLCAVNCPKKVLELTDRTNKRGYNYIEPVRQKDCIACGLCERICPDFALRVER